jgi:hypothetical protein
VITLRELGLGQDGNEPAPRESFMTRWARMRDMIRGPQKATIVVNRQAPLPPPIQAPAPAPVTEVSVSAPGTDTRTMVGAAVLGGLVALLIFKRRK